MNLRLRKIKGDLRSAKGKFVMITAALTLSATAIVAILNAYKILGREISYNYLSTNPASVEIELPTQSAELIQRVRALPGVDKAEFCAITVGRAEVSPGKWLPIRLFVTDDYGTAIINKVSSDSGQWPPLVGQILIEKSALSLLTYEVGGKLNVQYQNNDAKALTMTGVAYDPGQAPAWQEQAIYGYINPVTLQALGDQRGLRTLKIIVSDKPYDQKNIESVTLSIVKWLEANGTPARQITIPPPGKHPHETQMMGVLTIFLAFGLLALLVGGILSATVIGSLLTEHSRQIAVMKAIGARTRQIVTNYLLMIFLIAGLAVVAGQIFGTILGVQFAELVAKALNFKIYNSSVPISLILIEIALGIGVPLMISLFPIFKACRQPVRVALASYGIDSSRRVGALIEKIAGMLSFLGSDGVYAIRNTFRKKNRTVMTTLLLAVAGGVFIMSLNVQKAWDTNLDTAMKNRKYDVDFSLGQRYTSAELDAALSSIPQIAEYEMWSVSSALPKNQQRSELAQNYPVSGHNRITLYQAPQNPNLTAFDFLSGTWFTGSENEVVVNQALDVFYPDLKVGGTIQLLLNKELKEFKVVGIVREIIAPPAVYLSEETYAAVTGLNGFNRFRVSLKDKKREDQDATKIFNDLRGKGILVRSKTTASTTKKAQSSHVFILIYTFMFMALVMAGVGGFGLANAMSTSVLERTREFGIMRAIGARSVSISRLVVYEALTIGMMSYVLAIPIAYFLTKGVGNWIGMIAFRIPMPVVFSELGLLGWFVLTIVCAFLSSVIPAGQAAKLTIRQTLQYQ